MIGKHISIFYTPEDVARGPAAALLDAALAQGRVEDEGWRVRKDGSRFWADVVITALRDANGTLQGFGKVTQRPDRIARTPRRSCGKAKRTSRRLSTASATPCSPPTRRARVTRINPVAERLTGWSEKEAVGRPIEEVFNIVNEETRAKAPNPVTRVLAEGVVVGLANHTALIARDGTERPIADSGAPIRDARGRTRGAVLVFRDVTEDRRAEEALRQSEESLSATLYSIGDAVLATDEHARVTRINPVAERLTGWSEKEAIGRPIDEVFNIINEDTRAKAPNPVDARARGGRGRRARQSHRAHRARRHRTAHRRQRRAHPRRARGHARCRARLQRRDRGATRRGGAAAERGEARLMIASVSDYAIFMLDPQGRVASWNPGAERITGYREDEILGAHFSRFFTAEDVAAGQAGARARDRRPQRGTVRGRGLADPQGRLALLGERRDQRRCATPRAGSSASSRSRAT